MQLNLPILEQLKDSQNILIAGAGGGFDIFCGLPIYFTLRDMGKTVHLANYSHTELDKIQHVSDSKTLLEGQLVGTSGRVRRTHPYYPEGFLTQWLSETQGEPETIWMFARTGVSPLRESYQKLVEHLDIDTLILVDGGVDALMRGDEDEPGTLIEDSVSLAAISDLDVSTKIMCCLGFGAELDLSHFNALENMANLIKSGGFLGCCSLTKQMDVYQHYESACRYVWEQPAHARSHINMRVVSAVNGEFGDFHLYNDYWQKAVFVSPLMGLYWFFDADTVIDENMFIDRIHDTETVEDVLDIHNRFYRQLSHSRPHQTIPY